MDEAALRDSYLWAVLSSPYTQGNLVGLLSLLILFLARILPIISLSPFFGARVLPNPVKMTFALSLFVVFLPGLLRVTKGPVPFNFDLLFLSAKEMFIGFLLGLIMSLPFTIATTTGLIIDHQRGGASLMVNDPTVQNQSSPLGTLFNFVLIVLFFLINGPMLYIDAIYSSFEVIPPDTYFNPLFFSKDAPFTKLATDLLNLVMKMSIQLATPALLVILMTDSFLGIINRLAPQVQITFLGMPLKSLLGLGIIWLGWRPFVQKMGFDSMYFLDKVKDAIVMFHTGSG